MPSEDAAYGGWRHRHCNATAGMRCGLYLWAGHPASAPPSLRVTLGSVLRFDKIVQLGELRLLMASVQVQFAHARFAA